MDMGMDMEMEMDTDTDMGVDMGMDMTMAKDMEVLFPLVLFLFCSFCLLSFSALFCSQ